MSNDIKPPANLFDPSTGSPNGWTASSSKNDDEKLDPAAAKEMNPEDVDWHNPDGRYITWDKDNHEWIECGGNNGTRVYDPGTNSWHNDGEEAPATPLGTPPTGPAAAAPEGIYQPGSTTLTQGWTPSVNGHDISPAEASAVTDPTTIKWTDAGHPDHTIYYDKDKHVWVQQNGNDMKYYDPQFKNNPEAYKNNHGNPDSQGWNDQAYYDKYLKHDQAYYDKYLKPAAGLAVAGTGSIGV